ncbi:type II/IV secretion system ATPase subunit [Haloarcula sp. NS06]|uniref:type II/IV secretion system ATPase subunit n=1 Tax=Haloarcula TaxID=2237 RepID=UPI000F8F2D19|nr:MULTISPECIES: type II/IV secretion system ATPase subunit [Haloarcula]MDQ2073399.1 type II/IV secretion system ATPase subunit [Haloarcula sp. H-GB4]NHN64103.1 type II/IV secretion system ATPase subunit [Haloarcula sp. JP-Z28]NHX40245.1 type II/IV secretion system ATPase subunit [Haloarcula sp. R1-2]
MTDHGRAKPSDELRQMAARRPHLRDHLKKFKQITGEFPMLIDEADDDYETNRPNVLYPVGGPIFCHIYGDVGQDMKYYAIEPELDEDERAVFGKVRNRLLQRSVNKPAPENEAQFDDRIEELLQETTKVRDEDSENGVLTRLSNLTDVSSVEVTQETYENILYRLNRDIVGLGPLEPVMRDPANEDIHVIGRSECHVDHGVYGMLETTVEWQSEEAFDQWLRNMGERMGDPVSDSDPIVDSTLPDGSRLNLIYSDDVSLKGPSLTIRQGDDVPLSVFQITKWMTLSPQLAAYLWLCLENEQTVFVVGETASGKTTTLNAITSFIPDDAKIYTAEDTAEVLPPHNTWQQLLTREGEDEGTSIDMFDLVAAALRSRPDYIIVGEVRGEEGRMAFQAAQTGHPVMLTFHASDIVSMIQRFTGEPINVPETFMDVADVALFQNRVKQGDQVLRRVTSVQEIEGYSKEMDGVVTRQVFNWDPVEDEIIFQGMNNSFVLEEQIATLLGYEDTRDIYDDLEFRANLIERAMQEGILGYHEVNDFISDFQRDGVEGIPFNMARPD